MDSNKLNYPLVMSKLNSKLFKNKMNESKKSTEDISGYFEYKVEVMCYYLKRENPNYNLK